MNKVIWEFDLKLGLQSFYLPKGTEILDVQFKGAEPCLWAMCDAGEVASELRTIEVVGTGGLVNCQEGIERIYLGTLQLRPGKLVYHAFELKSLTQKSGG